jgi:hypothetical protein
MSVIYDALNKPDKDGDKENQDNGKNDNKPQGKGKNAAIVILLFLVICGALYFLGRRYVSKETVTNLLAKLSPELASANKKNSSARSSKPAAKRIIVPDKTYAPNKYVLEGIIYDNNGAVPLVIINGKVLKEKDQIDNYRVANISASRAELINLEDNTPKYLSF